jgi:DNA-binding transcriptional ArsR family regulator
MFHSNKVGLNLIICIRNIILTNTHIAYRNMRYIFLNYCFITYNYLILHIAICNTNNMAQIKNNLKPQDVLILLKIIALGNENWFHHTLAEELGMSQSEVSQSLNRSRYAGLIDEARKKVNRIAFNEFISHGLSYAFPQQPGPIVRGVLTAHSAEPLNQIINAAEKYVWPYARGNERGQSIEPLYNTVVEAILKDHKLYELLALVDALRVGRVREKEIAKKELEKRILNA